MTRLRSAFSGWMAAACGQLRGGQRMHRECRETLCSLLVDGRHMEERRREESARALGRFGGPSGRPHAAGSPRQGPKTHCTTGGVPMGPIGRCNAFGLSGGAAPTPYPPAPRGGCGDGFRFFHYNLNPRTRLGDLFAFTIYPLEPK